MITARTSAMRFCRKPFIYCLMCLVVISSSVSLGMAAQIHEHWKQRSAALVVAQDLPYGPGEGPCLRGVSSDDRNYELIVTTDGQHIRRQLSRLRDRYLTLDGQPFTVPESHFSTRIPVCRWKWGGAFHEGKPNQGLAWSDHAMGEVTISFEAHPSDRFLPPDLAVETRDFQRFYTIEGVRIPTNTTSVRVRIIAGYPGTEGLVSAKAIMVGEFALLGWNIQAISNDKPTRLVGP